MPGLRPTQISEHRAQTLHEYYTSGASVLVLWTVLGYCVAGAVAATLLGSILVALFIAGALVAVVGLTLLPRTRLRVTELFDERGLEPRGEREMSARRSRRQRQWGAVAVACLATAELTHILSQRYEAVGLLVVGGVAALVLILALLVLGWTTVWRYGDERPARPTDRARLPG